MEKIYWEEQESGFCAVHCINNVLQGAYFTEVDLSKIALDLDAKEKEIMAQQGMDNPDFIRWVAQDSDNVNVGGNFSIQVINTALEVMQLRAVNVAKSDQQALQQDPTQGQAYICHHGDHWFGVRKLMGSWFNLDSLKKKGPEFVSDFYLSAFLTQLRSEGYTVFAVLGSLPRPNTSLGGRGKWFTLESLLRGSGAGGRQGQHVMQRALSESKEQSDLERAIAMSLQNASSSATTPPNTAASSQSSSSTASSSSSTAAVSNSAAKPAASAPPMVDLTEVDDDEALRLAIEMSIAEQDDDDEDNDKGNDKEEDVSQDTQEWDDDNDSTMGVHDDAGNKADSAPVVAPAHGPIPQQQTE